MRRAILGLLGLLVLVLVVRWLVTRPVVRFSLGPGAELVTAPGVDSFAVREGEGLWRLYDTRSRQSSDGRLLPATAIGAPCLQSDGSAFVLTDVGLMWVHGSQTVVPGGEAVVVLRAEELLTDTRLEGVIGGTDPVLSAPDGPDGQRQLLVCDGAPAPAKPRVVRDADRVARVPPGARVLCSPRSRAVAFLGENGWEAWSLDGPYLSRRVVAEGCVRDGAVFTPDGRALIVPGRQDGIWLLSLADGRLDLMAEGNLGVSRRVQHAVGFRSLPALLVAPGWDLEGYLQIFQTHLSGGGRTAFGTGFMHHYGVALSPDGNFMTYAQGAFDEKAEAPFEEALYLFDFAQQSEAVYLDSREGGGRNQGPCFLGDGGSLVYLAHGQTMRIEVQPRPPREEPR